MPPTSKYIPADDGREGRSTQQSHIIPSYTAIIALTHIPRHTHNRKNLYSNSSKGTKYREQHPNTYSLLSRYNNANNTNIHRHHQRTTMPSFQIVILALTAAFAQALAMAAPARMARNNLIVSRQDSTFPEGLCDWEDTCRPLFQSCVRDCESLRGSEW